MKTSPVISSKMLLLEECGSWPGREGTAPQSAGSRNVTLAMAAHQSHVTMQTQMGFSGNCFISRLFFFFRTATFVNRTRQECTLGFSSICIYPLLCHDYEQYNITL